MDSVQSPCGWWILPPRRKFKQNSTPRWNATQQRKEERERERKKKLPIHVALVVFIQQLSAGMNFKYLQFAILPAFVVLFEYSGGTFHVICKLLFISLSLFLSLSMSLSLSFFFFFFFLCICCYYFFFLLLFSASFMFWRFLACGDTTASKEGKCTDSLGVLIHFFVYYHVAIKSAVALISFHWLSIRLLGDGWRPSSPTWLDRFKNCRSGMASIKRCSVTALIKSVPSLIPSLIPGSVRNCRFRPPMAARRRFLVDSALVNSITSCVNWSLIGRNTWSRFSWLDELSWDYLSFDMHRCYHGGRWLRFTN